MRLKLVAALIGLLCVAGCGGGGSSIGGSSSGTSSGGSGGGGSTPPTGSNVQPVTVDNGPSAVANSNTPAVNTLYTSVTICSPGSTTNCQTIDHIQVDTGSSGLRIISTALALTLPLLKDSGGNAIAECVQFVDGSSWGPLRLADIKMSGEVASNLPVQIIGETTYNIPSACSGTGTEDTVTAFGANGILGIGPFIQDCGTGCTVQGHGVYFSCSSSTTCTDTAMPLASQVSNPVASFATDNNGVSIQLSSVSGTAASVSGYLIFGIGTQGNNGVGSAKVFTLASDGSLTTDYNSSALTESFIDSGSNAYYFPDSNITVCTKTSNAPGFYCPTSTLSLTGTIVGANSVMSTVNFSVANASSLFTTSTTIAAASTLAAPSTSVAADGSTFTGTNTFDWGLPFYYGRTVYTAIETKNTSAGMGPYFAF